MRTEATQPASTMTTEVAMVFHFPLTSSGRKNTAAIWGLHMAKASTTPVRMGWSSSKNSDRTMRQQMMPLWLPKNTALAHRLGANTSSEAASAFCGSEI